MPPHLTPPPAQPPQPSSASASNSSSLEPYLLDYDLRRILGSSLNKELETSLSKILDPHFTGLEASAQKTPAPKPTTPKSQKKKGSGKSKGGSKSQEPSAKTTTQAASQGATKSTTTPGSVKKTEPEASRADPDSSKAQASKNSTMEVLVCPECGSHTEIPGGNISLIPYNFFMQHIMDLMTYYSSREPVPLVYCSMCRKDGLTDLPPAVARCSTCASFLCKQCYELHSIDDFTKLHSTLSITERGESSIFSCLTPDDTKVRNCKGHGWKPFVYFCITCSKGICEVCSKQDHKTHLFAKPEVLRPGLRGLYPRPHVPDHSAAPADRERRENYAGTHVRHTAAGGHTDRGGPEDTGPPLQLPGHSSRGAAQGGGLSGRLWVRCEQEGGKENVSLPYIFPTSQLPHVSFLHFYAWLYDDVVQCHLAHTPQ